MLSDATLSRAAEVLEALRTRGLTVATAESCTGGLVAAALTAVPGSSDVVLAGLVTYSNGAKRDLLGVEDATLRSAGAVSEEVARAMAAGAVARTGADLGVSTTGIAGPGGGTPGKPVGLVHLAVARRGEDADAATHRRVVLPGDRAAVRSATVGIAFELLAEAAAAPPPARAR